MDAFKRRFSVDFACPAVLAGLAIAAVPAHAQDAQPPSEEVETVIVSGQNGLPDGAKISIAK